MPFIPVPSSRNSSPKSFHDWLLQISAQPLHSRKAFLADLSKCTFSHYHYVLCQLFIFFWNCCICDLLSPIVMSTPQENSHKETAGLSMKTLQVRRERQGMFKLMKEKNVQSWLLYIARISFRYEGEIKSFSDKQKLKEFSTTKPALHQMLNDLP